MDLVDSGLIEAREVGSLSYIKKKSLVKYIKSTNKLKTQGGFSSGYKGALVPMALFVLTGFSFISHSFISSNPIADLGHANLSAVVAPFASFLTEEKPPEGSYLLGKQIGNVFGAVLDGTLKQTANGLLSYSNTSISEKIDDILSNDTPEYISAQVSNTGTEDTGIVIVPTQGVETDAKVIADIKDSFSDDVLVIPNNDGASGIIRPVFKSGYGKDFLYVIVPVD